MSSVDPKSCWSGQWVVIYANEGEVHTAVMAGSKEIADEEVRRTVLLDLATRLRSYPLRSSRRERLENLKLELFLTKDSNRLWDLVDEYCEQVIPEDEWRIRVLRCLKPDVGEETTDG